MKNKIKIIFNEEHKTLGYLVQNDKYEWVKVPETSKLSREEYTHINIEDNPRKILEYISDVYAPCDDDEVELVLEAFPYECTRFLSEVSEYKNMQVITQDINILVCGKAKSGKSTLIRALTKEEDCIKEECWDIYKNNNISWYEISGLDIEEGSYNKIIQNISKLFEEVNITTVIYCTSADSNRLENAEGDLIEYIREKLSEVQIVVAITKAIDEVGAKKWAKEIMEWQKGIVVVPVLAQKIETKAGTIDIYGLYTIYNYIFEGI